MLEFTSVIFAFITKTAFSFQNTSYDVNPFFLYSCTDKDELSQSKNQFIFHSYFKMLHI